MENIILLATASGSITKSLIDILKIGVDLPKWVPPVIALLAGPLFVLLFLVYQREAITLAAGAACVLGGILAAGWAVGATELGARAQTQTNTFRRGNSQ